MKRQSPEEKLLRAIYGPPRDFKTNPYTPAEKRKHKRDAAALVKELEEEQERADEIARKPRNVAARARRAAKRSKKTSAGIPGRSFFVQFADLKSQPFQYVPAQPIEVGGKRYQTFVAYDPALELIHVELRLVMKEDHNDRA